MFQFHFPAVPCSSACTPADGSIDAAHQRPRLDAMERGKPFGVGPREITLAMALSDYLPQRVLFRRPGNQLVRSVNRYLRHAGLPTYATVPVLPQRREVGEAHDKKTVEFTLERVPASRESILPRALEPNRCEPARHQKKSEQLRARLACMTVADITRNDIQQLLLALREERWAAPAIAREQLILRAFFNHTRTTWHWAEPQENPATTLDCRAMASG
ncbi:hypothetical protein WQE_15216 [Paraburkholderia hospita]|uniref:Transposase n=1 Tax=Paraburkholderia hospita TaxID=169430 RepID=A0ABP2PRE3_9BURK|nr:hypothetical protein [Paraburkholderia hospita]EIN00392.1 hypothetical protein WQE_15216 [Paraburkholderia hospita]OUL88403.1 hypothetical protein CA602_11110 [Paraburkholderia hospita]